jgi:hypothetical protein
LALRPEKQTQFPAEPNNSNRQTHLARPRPLALRYNES